MDTPESQPERQAQEIAPGPLKFQVRLSYNTAKNGLQLHFPGKPSDEIRAELKAAGWRWSFKNGYWYHRDIPANRDFAERFIIRLNGATAPEPEMQPAVPTNVIPLPQPPRASMPTWRMRLITPLK
ncbi:MAG TPA: hypothetical protein VGY56_02475 [Verrucomicrobiae bacterium]|nr:hypothetical protein [Verrucomicrobiae bacterium]